MASSIEIPNAWKLANIPDDHLADYLQIAQHDVPARRAALAVQFTDPAWIATTLEALPAATLVVLHLIVGARGVIDEDSLAALARERFGLPEAGYRAAKLEAVKRMLAVPLASRSCDRLLAVVQPAAALIAPLVSGLDLVELPAADFVASEPPACHPRTFVAACVAALHTEIKLTAAGRVHRGSIKRLARQVGLDEASLVALLETGLDVGVLRRDDEGDVARPDLVALAAAADGRYPRYAPLSALAAQLGEAPLDSVAVARLLQRSLRAEHASLARDALGWLPGFVTGTVNGVAACLYRAPVGAAAGHVTPSFEVFLPPESRLIDVIHVGACCEWERLDRAFVARITKSSISAAIAAGVTSAQILAHLASASRHPIPQNVEAAIRDWAGSVVPATIASGHVIVVDPGASARVASALARLAARELAPGVFVVDGDERLRDITAALGKAGVHLREVSPVCDEPAVASVPVPRAAAPELVLPPGAARLRKRVAAWRRGEPFEGVRDDFLDKQRATPPAPPRAAPESTPRAAPPAPPRAAPESTPRALIERWAAAHNLDMLRDRLKLASLVDLASLLPAREITALLDDCRTVADVITGISGIVVERGRQAGANLRAGSARRPPALLWQREGLRERLRYAGQRGEALALELATGVRYVEIARVLQRGTKWMVLGEDLETADAVAVPLDTVEAIAALPADFDIDSVMPDENEDDDEDDEDFGDEGGAASRKPWRPAPGKPVPAGHVLCPCGSGVRYRLCCRPGATG